VDFNNIRHGEERRQARLEPRTIGVAIRAAQLKIGPMSDISTRIEPLPAADAERLDADGYLLLRGLASAADVEAMRRAFDDGETADWPAPRGADWRHALVDLDPAVQRVCKASAMLAAARRLLGGPFLFAQVEGREPRPGGGHQLLHRDAAPGAGGQVVSALIFLDPWGQENGGTRLAPGTHRGAGLAAPDGQEHPATVALAGEAGDALVFDAKLLHGATRNVSGARRRSLLACYISTALQGDYEATRRLRAVRMETGEVFAAP